MVCFWRHTLGDCGKFAVTNKLCFTDGIWWTWMIVLESRWFRGEMDGVCVFTWHGRYYIDKRPRTFFGRVKDLCKFERKTHRDRRRKKNKDTRNYTQKRHSIPIFWWSELKSKMYSNNWILSNVWLISSMKSSVRIVVLERVRMNINTQISSHCAEESEI